MVSTTRPLRIAQSFFFGLCLLAVLIPWGSAAAETPSTLILDNRDNAWGDIYLDGIYRNGGFEYSPASVQWTSAHFSHLPNGRYVNIYPHLNCATNVCQHVRDYNSSDWWRQGVYRSTAIPTGQKAWLLNADVYVAAHNVVTGNNHGIAVGYSIGASGQAYNGGYFSFQGLAVGETTQIRNQCVNIPGPPYPTGGASLDQVFVGKMPGSVNGQDSGSYYVDNITIYTIDVPCSEYEPPTPPPPPITEENVPFAITATCGITATNVTISGTEIITETIAETIPANIVQNASFETVASGQPIYWTVDPAYTVTSLENPSDGAYSLKLQGTPALQIRQNFGALPSVPPTVTWRIGLEYQEGSYDFLAPVPQLGRFEVGGMNASPPSLLHPVATSGYAPISYTLNMSNVVGGLTSFLITMPDLANLPAMAGNVAHYVDSVYVIPIYEDGGFPFVYCPAVAEYEPPDPDVGGGNGNPVEGVGGIPVPIGGAGETCWECRWPAGRGVEMAIAWLGCVLRNMFACSLRIWLLQITGAVVGVYATLSAWGLWAAFSAQGAINWLGYTVVQDGAGWLNSALAAIQPGTVVESGSGVWDFLIALLRVIPDTLAIITGLLGMVLDAALTIISLIGLAMFSVLGIIFDLFVVIFSAIPAIWQALSAPAVSMDDFLTAQTLTTNYDALVGFAWGVGLVDEWLVSYSIIWLMYPLMGAMFVNVVLWIKEQFTRQWF